MKNPFVKKYSLEELKQIRELARFSVFRKLTKSELAHFIPKVYERTYQQNEVVYFSDDPSMALYIIKSGKVAFNLVRGNEFEPLLMLEEGQSFGENALVVETKRLLTAIVVSPNAILHVIPSSDMMEIMDAYPVIKAKVFEAMATDMSYREQQLITGYRNTFGFFEISEVFKKMF